MKCNCSVLEDSFFMCSDCEEIDYKEIKKRIAKQREAIIQLSQFMGQLNHNSGGLRPSPNFNNYFEEEIKKILE